MTAKEPAIDFARLSFPTDRLMIKDIRTKHPALFAQEMPQFFESPFDADDVSSVLYVERMLAHKAFAAALGRPDPHADDEKSREELIEMLHQSYVEYGLSAGQHNSKELIREIEDGAVALARTFLGGSRQPGA